MDEVSGRPKTSSPWLKNNLLTLGSAAVFTVYGAGYFRTREAADRFAGESVQRHAASVATPASERRSAPAQAVAASSDVAKPTVIKPSSNSAAGESASTSAGNPAATIASAADSPAPATSPVAPQSSAPTEPATPAPAPAPAAAPAEAPATQPEKNTDSNQLKDGVFYGWGTSRHGDIQAAVEIKDGKIVGAYISQCLTRYSCSWISALPPEVTQRQSAEVDYVSGATQSSNAFYYAVVEALKKAK